MFYSGAYVSDRPLRTDVEQEASTSAESSTSLAAVSINQNECCDEASTSRPTTATVRPASAPPDSRSVPLEQLSTSVSDKRMTCCDEGSPTTVRPVSPPKENQSFATSLSAVTSLEPCSISIMPPTQGTPTSDLSYEQSASISSAKLVSPEEIRPYPKAGSRKSDSKVCRRKGNTRILTDTPVKLQLQRDAEVRIEKKARKRKLFPTGNSKDKEATSKERREAKKQNIARSGRTCKKMARAPKMSENSDDRCTICKVVYGDKADQKCHEDWLKCSVCAHWFHDSCAQAFGVVDDDETFTCRNCV